MNKSDNANNTAYPFSLPAVKNLEKLKLNNNITFFVGENGTGKSTLLEAIAVNYGFNPEGGSKNFIFSTMSTHSELHKHITLAKGVYRPKDGYFLRAESFYNVATEIEKLDSVPSFSPSIKQSYGGKSLHEQSHGESFWSLIINRFSGNGLYLMDEPEAALSPSRQMALLARMYELEKLNSQFIIATHSPILLAYPNAQIFVLTNDKITPTPYKETEHYIITKQFINNPERMLKHLLD
ncbi:MAG: AAA family ATPase [Oscillospiraceae bacterium]|nr:AAA family ATPase [Oscillospiraceae bacterium]